MRELRFVSLSFDSGSVSLDSAIRDCNFERMISERFLEGMGSAISVT
jgi:hypothetical protein